MILKTTETPSYYKSLVFTCGKTGIHLRPEGSGLNDHIVLASLTLAHGPRYYQESDHKNLIFSGKAENVESAVFCESGGEEGTGWGEGRGTAQVSVERLQDIGYYLVLN